MQARRLFRGLAIAIVGTVAGTGFAAGGPFVDEKTLSGDFHSSGVVWEPVEVVTAQQPFDSVSWCLGFSASDRFYSVYQPGVLLFVR